MSFDFEAWPRAGSARLPRAAIRVKPEDFLVEEQLGFELSGQGEFVWLEIRKTLANTDWVARQIARRLGLPGSAVSYSGLKDRRAVTRQFFSIHLPGKPDPDLDALDLPGVEMLGAFRHRRKLRRGTHSGNRFRIRLRDFAGEPEQLRAGVERIRGEGVPNYFGPQRFGHDGANVERARALYRGELKSRDRRFLGLLHSTARALLFNEALARRIERGDWAGGADGDLWMLDSSQSIFGPEFLSEELSRRAARGEIHPTGPLWGAGQSPAGGAVAELERAVAAAHPELTQGLADLGLKPERRSLRMMARDLECAPEGDDWWLSFTLGRGQFATALLRELIVVASDPA